MSNTDDLEAKTREWWISKFPTADPDTDAARFEFKMLMNFYEHARSLAQPPSSEMIREADIMRRELHRLACLHGDDAAHVAVVNYDNERSTHPKDPAPTVERAARCDYRKPGCVNDGNKINGVWVCKNHQSVKA